ncbi:hypothetical protein COLO4_32557 [Corchorus olitorius]|uniref:Uncharacterized protein n=1 Tax=Corchorus olitorius TaxID=93759 RepID=A0A1R3GZ09_9ROSI|nr:hypothetical protein COLO4_32557 [Corchorus olitorius]
MDLALIYPLARAINKFLQKEAAAPNLPPSLNYVYFQPTVITPVKNPRI